MMTGGLGGHGASLAVSGFFAAYLLTLGLTGLESLIVYVVLGLGQVAADFREVFAIVVYSEAPTMLGGILLAIPFTGLTMLFALSILSVAVLSLVIRRSLGAGRFITMLVILIAVLLHASTLTSLTDFLPWILRTLRSASGF